MKKTFESSNYDGFIIYFFNNLMQFSALHSYTTVSPLQCNIALSRIFMLLEFSVRNVMQFGIKSYLKFFIYQSVTPS